MTKKKITKVESSTDNVNTTKNFKPSEEGKKKATTNRIIAVVLWVLAIVFEVFAILQFQNDTINTMLLLGLIAVDAVLAISGSMLWKKSNRLDPASENDKVRFFIQNQLGFIISIIAFLPLIILLLSNEKLDNKQKSLITGIAVVALAIAAIFGIEYNPKSIEQYTKEAQHVETLTGKNHVYWTKSGRKYHLFDDCHTINTSKTDEIFEGTVAKAYELKNIKELCNVCERRALNEKSETGLHPSLEYRNTV